MCSLRTLPLLTLEGQEQEQVRVKHMRYTIVTLLAQQSPKSKDTAPLEQQEQEQASDAHAYSNSTSKEQGSGFLCDAHAHAYSDPVC